MSTFISILSSAEKKLFESPPVFSDEERVTFFEVPQWAHEILEILRTPTNKAGFLVQLGYFRSANKFFNSKQFHKRDTEFVAKLLSLSGSEVHLESYSATTYERHQSLIAQNLGFSRFDQNAKKIVEREAVSLSRAQIRPRSVFMSLVDFMRSKKIEVPSYHALSEIITEALKVTERDMYTQIGRYVTAEQKQLLDDLLEIREEYLSEDKCDLKLKRYKITLLKKSNQSTRPSKIRENIRDAECLRELFDQLEPAIGSLQLTSETIRFYARIALRSQVFQLARRDERKYLYLLAFVIHQYYRLNDLLVDVILQSVQTSRNTASREHKERVFKARATPQLAIRDLSESIRNHLLKLKEVETIVNTEIMSDSEKVEAIRALLRSQNDCGQLEQQLRSSEVEVSRLLNDDDYYDILESKSLRLQNRVTPIVKNLEFDAASSDEVILSAIEHFRKKDGNIGPEAPLGFLDEDQRQIVFNPSGRLRISLYKALLFQATADGIKSGTLNLKHSYKYRPFEDYMIPEERWESEKEELLERTGLTGFDDFAQLEPELREALNDHLRRTNENIRSENNPYAKFDNKGHLIVSTPKKEKMKLDPVASLFPKDRVIPVFEVLSTVNDLTGFTHCFEHHQLKHVRKRPTPNVFIAGVTGLGCNHGIRRISKISKNISLNELEYAVNWHFTAENLIHSNDRVLELIERLRLPQLLKKDTMVTHTSSDGQKYSIHVESLNANFSYKYFGNGKGVTVYVFIDESHRLFYSVVISSSESEAAYVIDGLMHNDVVRSDIHFTDTAGYNEVIFAVCHLLGISFAPRIRNFTDQQLYSFDKHSVWKALGYQILHGERINTKIIRENWDEILRFIATIKLRQTPASQLFRRLSSYSRQHPLYKALKEFGKVIKTLFLLRYIDDLELRQAIEKQLNKQENSNKFGKAVFHGNDREFRQSTKEEQMIAEGCKRLIENSVICWNYLYLSQLIHDAKSEEERKALIEVIRNGSVVIWHHINMQGEYDFSNEYLKGALEFRLEDLLKLQLI